MPAAGEECDDGNSLDGDGCSAACLFAGAPWACPVPGQPCELCGDGTRDPNENCDDGGNLAARAHMLAAASMGATAFQKGLGAIHSLSHPIGAIYDTHHGLTNAVVMPYVLAFNRPAVADKMERLAAWLGLAQPSFEAVQDWILGLRSALSIPHSLREIGVGDDRIEEIAEMAAVDPTAPTNPLPLDSENLRAMMENALEGRVD